MRNTQIDDQLIQKYGLLMQKVSKLLADMASDAKAHGFDVSPYLAKLAEMNIVNATDVSETGAVRDRRH